MRYTGGAWTFQRKCRVSCPFFVLVRFKVFAGGLEIAVNSVVRRACTQTLDGLWFLLAVCWERVKQCRASEDVSAEGKRVGSWDAWVGVWRSLFGVGCLSDELCGVHDHKILLCCNIPGKSLDITNMLHGNCGCVAGILFWFLWLLMLLDGCCVFSLFMIVSSLCFDWVCSLGDLLCLVPVLSV